MLFEMLKNESTMYKKNVTVIFDRLGAVKKTGRGKVEIRVYLDRNVRKYIVVGETTKTGWLSYQNSKELQLQVEKYDEIVRAVILHRPLFRHEDNRMRMEGSRRPAAGRITNYQ